jgi:hypothetical protein
VLPPYVLLNNGNGVAFPRPFSAPAPRIHYPRCGGSAAGNDDRQYDRPRRNIHGLVSGAPRGRHRRGDRSSLFNPATDPSDWAALTAAAAEIPLTAILNPNSGPGTSQDLGYVSAINASPRSHVHWIGRFAVPFEQYEVGERWRSLMVGDSSSGDRDLGSSRHARRAFLSLDLEGGELSRLRPESVAWRGGGASAGCREWVAQEGLKLAPS